jgi:hypothetical protein
MLAWKSRAIPPRFVVTTIWALVLLTTKQLIFIQCNELANLDYYFHVVEVVRIITTLRQSNGHVHTMKTMYYYTANETLFHSSGQQNNALVQIYQFVWRGAFFAFSIQHRHGKLQWCRVLRPQALFRVLVETESSAALNIR